mmetsp:Transcript_88687/g.271543  ORF Transcript_88687/g.271543 Transcript_88687/m.271543 type:complete len:262 (+) Transcript_88687:266-1051(+)
MSFAPFRPEIPRCMFRMLLEGPLWVSTSVPTFILMIMTCSFWSEVHGKPGLEGSHCLRSAQILGKTVSHSSVNSLPWYSITRFHSPRSYRKRYASSKPLSASFLRDAATSSRMVSKFSSRREQMGRSPHDSRGQITWLRSPRTQIWGVCWKSSHGTASPGAYVRTLPFHAMLVTLSNKALASSVFPAFFILRVATFAYNGTHLHSSSDFWSKSLMHSGWCINFWANCRPVVTKSLSLLPVSKVWFTVSKSNKRCVMFLSTQ